MAACLWALALHLCIAHAAGALQGSPGAARLVRAKPVLARGPPAPGARSRALLATLGESDAPPGLRRAAQVSDRGRFRSTRGVVNRGTLVNRGSLDPTAYHCVGIGGKLYRLHHLVCTAWHGPPPTPEHTQVYHKDGDQMNNTPANLRWTTPSKNTQRSHTNNSNLKSSAIATSKPVRGRKQGTADEWRHFESCRAAARELGPGFDGLGVWEVAKGKYTHTRGWTFKFTQQHEDLTGEVWKDVVLPSTSIHDEVLPKESYLLSR